MKAATPISAFCENLTITPVFIAASLMSAPAATTVALVSSVPPIQAPATMGHTPRAGPPFRCWAKRSSVSGTRRHVECFSPTSLAAVTSVRTREVRGRRAAMRGLLVSAMQHPYQRSGSCADELDGLWRDDRVAIGAQSSHSGGSPMSQRECAEFNWPPLAVSAGDPLGVGPETTSCTWSSKLLRPVSVRFAWPPCPVVQFGVAHDASATVLRLLSVLPAALLPFCAGVPAIGVGQLASRATSFSGRLFLSCRFEADDFQSRD